MTQDWAAVDGYIAEKLLGADPALDAALAANAAAGLPAIDVSAAQGRMLELLARMAGARSILEVGTLGGYSTICLAAPCPRTGISQRWSWNRITPRWRGPIWHGPGSAIAATCGSGRRRRRLRR